MSLGAHMPKIKISIKFKHLFMIIAYYYFICCQLSTSLSWKDFE